MLKHHFIRLLVGSAALGLLVPLAPSVAQQTTPSAGARSTYQRFIAQQRHAKATAKPRLNALRHAFSNPYALMLINETDHVIRMVSVDGGVHRAATQLIGRTCSYPNVDQCFNEQK